MNDVVEVRASGWNRGLHAERTDPMAGRQDTDELEALDGDIESGIADSDVEVDGEAEPMESGVLYWVEQLGRLGDGAIITESGLAKLFHRHRASVRRAVGRGEIPPPIQLMKRRVWSIGAIRRHLDMRLKEAADDVKARNDALKKHRPAR